MSQIPSVLAFVASIVGAGTVLGPGLIDGGPTQASPTPAPQVVVPAEPAPSVGGRPGTITVRREGNGLFYMPGRVNGVDVRFLLDSGANMVILPGPLAASAGVPTGQQAGQARTVAGGARFALSRARRIEAAGWTIPDLPVAIAADSSAPPILGMNALTRMGRITLLRNEVVFEAERPERGTRPRASLTR